MNESSGKAISAVFSSQLAAASVVLALAVSGMVAWSFFFRYHPALVDGLQGFNTALVQFDLKKGEDRQWRLYEAGKLVGVAELDAGSAIGEFHFSVVSSTSADIPQGRKFDLEQQAIGLVCAKCIRFGNPAGRHALPIHWAIE